MPKGVYPRHVKRHAVIQPQDPSYKIIPLTQGQNTMVTATDYPWLNQWNWCAHWSPKTKSFYAMRQNSKNGKRYTVYMAREILRCEPGEEADHRDRNTLDNRRGNLRKATRPQNARNHKIQSNNTTGHKGVYWNKKNKKWVAMIGHKGKLFYLGYFSSIKKASYTRNEFAKKFHTEFAYLNSP